MPGLPPLHDRRRTDDTGDIVLGWLTKLVVGLGLLGLIAFDAIAIGSARLSVQDQAGASARAASESYLQNHDAQAAYQAAAVAAEADPANEVPPSSFTAEHDGTVTLRVRRTAGTLVVQHIGWIDQWADVSAVATGKDVS